MKLKGRTILVLCLLLFGGYALFDYLQDQKKAERTLEESRLMTLNFEQVDTVEIQQGDQKIVLKRTVDGWNMQEPLQDKADNDVADEFVKGIFMEKIMDVAAAGDKVDWALYGLDKPVGTITLTTTEGKKNSFKISAKTNFENNTFLKRDDEKRVLVSSPTWPQRLEKKPIDFRDRRFFRHGIASVDELKLKNTKGTLHLKRHEGQWGVEGQKDLKLDQNEIRALLTSLNEAHAAEILPSVPKNLKTLFVLDLSMDGKKWNARVGQANDKMIYAEVSEPVFKMKMEPGALDRWITLTAENLKEKPPQPTGLDAAKAEKEK